MITVVSRGDLEPLTWMASGINVALVSEIWLVVVILYLGQQRGGNTQLPVPGQYY